MLILSIISKIKFPNLEKLPKILKKGIKIQPFESRGITPFFGLFFISLYYFTCFLQICFNYEQILYIYYLFFTIIQAPSAIAIFTIIPLNSMKWIFLLNLNTRKVFKNFLKKGIFL
jgi:hypothetical protein